MAKHKYVETPEILYELFEKYKIGVLENPRHQYQLSKTGETIPVPLRVPLTMEGFENYCEENIGCVHQYFGNQDKAYGEYLAICSRIKRLIRQDQIEGGMTGQYNPSITQRINGLAEKTENKTIEIKVLNIDPLDDSTDHSIT